MTRFKAATLVFCLLMTIASSCFHALSQELVWVSGTTDNNGKPIPDAFDLSGDTFNLIANSLEGVTINYLQSNMARGEKILQATANACMGNRLYTSERAKFSYRTQYPQLVFPGQRLFVEPDSSTGKAASQIATQGTISLNEMLNSNTRIEVGVVGSRSYGSDVDALLETRPENVKLWKRVGENNARGLISMFISGRVEAIIEYPSVFYHYARKHNADVSRFDSFGIEEEPEYMMGYILCAKTEQGKKLIEMFDNVLADLTQQKQYLDAHTKWFDKAMHPKLTAFYNQAFGTMF